MLSAMWTLLAMVGVLAVAGLMTAVLVPALSASGQAPNAGAVLVGSVIVCVSVALLLRRLMR